MRRREVLIAYDIQKNSRRYRVRRCLQEWELASQYSVFECRLSAREAEELFLQLTNMIDEENDKLILVWMDKLRNAKALTPSAQLGFQSAAWYVG